MDSQLFALDQICQIDSSSRNHQIDRQQADFAPNQFRLCIVWIDTARPYLAGGGLLASAIATSVAFLLIGSLKSRWSVRSAWRSGLETLAIGGIAATLAYAAGHILASLLS